MGSAYTCSIACFSRDEKAANTKETPMMKVKIILLKWIMGCCSKINEILTPSSLEQPLHSAGPVVDMMDVLH